MASNSNKEWKNLRVGDRVRIVRLPHYANDSNKSFRDETRSLYERLIARGRSLRVYEVDKEGGLPWVNCRLKQEDGTIESHYLALNDDSWILVKRRT